MSWNPQMEVHYVNGCFPYNSAGSSVNLFEGLAYEHVNLIFADSVHSQETVYPPMQTSFYKFGLSEPGNFSYYDCYNGQIHNDDASTVHEYHRHFENSQTILNEHTDAATTQWNENAGANTPVHVECPRDQPSSIDSEVIWQDNVDPDNMTYEELLELGEVVGTESRGLAPDLISLLPVRKFKRGFFSRKNSKIERCVICQMEYKRGDKQITLPCKHVYHVCCGTKWLGINKACPICYTEVFGDESKH
ncbi:E3 ubiquitin-protein ligase BIG BROTHER-like [Impatiens glandulifera]|uniref:E3 ubiquitin-protein ligase BIG BROTHER-like n=1 Tax=Impatiens glandulifera TaxID=253017 RepID=UPI001FB0FDAD|nr:E3 ubiquitin-protein ligase BIG BROTHER-like [Impatiens glandulifera]XP_047308658.1 E3 ubiquitin-protein ligase BIG BROTHER-like [Impatiens glandulifera]